MRTEAGPETGKTDKIERSSSSVNHRNFYYGEQYTNYRNPQYFEDDESDPEEEALSPQYLNI